MTAGVSRHAVFFAAALLTSLGALAAPGGSAFPKAVGDGSPFGSTAVPRFSLQRYLDRLYLGSTIEEVKKTYPPKAQWPSYKTGLIREPSRMVKRIRLDGSDAAGLPPRVEEMRLGLRRGRVVEIEMIYDPDYTQDKPAEAFAGEYALVYGKPRQSWGRFWWADKRTVLRILYEPADPAKPAKSKTEGLRVGVQLLEKSLFQ